MNDSLVRMWKLLKWNGSVLQAAASFMATLIGIITVPVLIATWRAEQLLNLEVEKVLKFPLYRHHSVTSNRKAPRGARHKLLILFGVPDGI